MLLRYEPQAAGFLARPLGTDDDAPAPDRDSMIDRQLGSYRLLALLGAGGMGAVYRARDTKLGREVAIKILPPHLTAEPERRARFAREARLLATLTTRTSAPSTGSRRVTGSPRWYWSSSRGRRSPTG